eukprot:2164150-Karenia_brevis.AAC.1
MQMLSTPGGAAQRYEREHLAAGAADHLKKQKITCRSLRRRPFRSPTHLLSPLQVSSEAIA